MHRAQAARRQFGRMDAVAREYIKKQEKEEERLDSGFAGGVLT